MKKYDILASAKINFNELSNEIKAEIGVLGGLDIFTDAHVQGVVDITTKICTEMKMPYAMLKRCVLAAYLHDVGKIFIPSEILQKREKLTAEEYEIMKTHTTLGYDICMKYPQFKEFAPIVRAHHESFDGSGYPDGLKGEEIPYESSLIKVADYYDALTRRRQYKEGMSLSDTIQLMIDEVEKDRMCAKFLYYLISYLVKKTSSEVEEELHTVASYEKELETLHELENIYKEIYDQGYTKKLEKKLNRYQLQAGYDMSANAKLLISKQKVYEEEHKAYETLIAENQKLQKQLKQVEKLAKKEKWYR